MCQLLVTYHQIHICLYSSTQQTSHSENITSFSSNLTFFITFLKISLNIVQVSFTQLKCNLKLVKLGWQNQMFWYGATERSSKLCTNAFLRNKFFKDNKLFFYLLALDIPDCRNFCCNSIYRKILSVSVLLTVCSNLHLN